MHLILKQAYEVSTIDTLILQLKKRRQKWGSEIQVVKVTEPIKVELENEPMLGRNKTHLWTNYVEFIEELI